MRRHQADVVDEIEIARAVPALVDALPVRESFVEEVMARVRGGR